MAPNTMISIEHTMANTGRFKLSSDKFITVSGQLSVVSILAGNQTAN